MARPYQELSVSPDGNPLGLSVRFRLENRSRETVAAGPGFCVGWQLYDPGTSAFLGEGDWTPLPVPLVPGGSAEFALRVQLPPEEGSYRVLISPRSDGDGWYYTRGWPFVLLEAEVRDGRIAQYSSRVASMPALNRLKGWRAVMRFATAPWKPLWRHRRLTGSMARRDIAARYRGSLGDVLWTVLHPLLLMGTYFFVFGVVLQARFAGDNTRTGFALYFLAGLLPWLPFSEAVSRAPSVMIEHRNFVKKMLYPLETIPVHQAIAALVTEAFALAVFLVLLLVLRGGVPGTVVWLPLVIVPQLLLTVGVSWFLSALGVFVRDLGQVIGFLMTIGFFLVPICYPETSLPKGAEPLLEQNPVFTFVRIYRAILLEGTSPHAMWMARVWTAGVLVFLAGYAWFHRLRRSFPDVI